MVPGGRTIGSIVVEERISTSAQGEIFLGRQPGLDRRVLLRKLRRDLLGSTPIVERFRREARLAARVLHPNVQQVFDFFQDRGDHYLVLEHVDGPTLRAVLDRTGKLPPRIATGVALELVRGLEEIHRRGVIHTDIRAEHVLISRWGEVKLTGLGSAREVAEAQAPDPLEITACTAPEIQQGIEVGPAADVYSVAALLCELLTGRPGEAGLLAAAALKPMLARALRRCLKDRAGRRPKLSSLRRALERAAGRGLRDPRLETAAWLWEVRMLRPRELPYGDTADTADAADTADTPDTQREAEPTGPRHAEVPAEPQREVTRRRNRSIAAASSVVVLLASVAIALNTRDPEEGLLPEVDTAPPLASAPQPKPESAANAKPARVSFVAIPWAEITIDGGAPFLTPRAAPVELAAGEHEILFKHPRFGEVRRTLVIHAGEERVLRHGFERKFHE